MSIVRKVRAVERLFAELEAESAAFKTNSGMNCPTGCSRCCTKPDIPCTPLEFLPLALHYFMEGKAHQVLDALQHGKSSVCHLYGLQVAGSFGGGCSNYEYRGLTCRLFGFATVRNKYNQRVLSTCGVLKEAYPEAVAGVPAYIAEGGVVPSFLVYGARLRDIDPNLGATVLPINEAVAVAIETVLRHYAYRRPPRNLKRTA